MKKSILHLLSILLSICVLFSLSACSSSDSSVSVDYKNAETFESALNDGDNVVGKTVKFHADSLHPESRYGYNIWAGEHLNFISADSPGIKRGETVVVMVTSTLQLDNGSWLIYYDIAGTENSSSKTDSLKPSSSTSKATFKKAEPKSLQITETGLYIESSYLWDDTVYINYIGFVHNPNNEETALFPKLIATAKNPDGTILAADEQSGSVIMPGDTIPIMGTFSIISSEIKEGSYVDYQVECKSFQEDSFIYSSARTTDFKISNISEHSGSRASVTGEVKSSFSENVSMLKIIAIFRKDNKIAGVERTYIDLSAYQSKAFEIDSLTGFPEHDSVEIYAVPSL